jgi:uncharacterized repeat protein (TIGR03803 family)
MLRRLARVALFAVCIASVNRTLSSAQIVTGSTLYTFSGGTDGAVPNSLMQASDGNFYGTTTFGGNSLQAGACGQGTGCGTIFRQSPSGDFTSLYVFTGGGDGSYPNPLIQGSDGNLYGTTIFGGSGTCTDVDLKVLIGCGTIFRVSLNGDLTTLYSFYGGVDGAFPNQLVQGSNGNLFGTTVSSVFEMSLAGELVALYDFTGQGDGWVRLGVTEGSDGNFYGITEAGGSSSCEEGCGTVFSITPSGIFTTLYTFTGEADGGNLRPEPDGRLTLKEYRAPRPSIVIRQPRHIIEPCPPICDRGDLAVYSNLLVQNGSDSFVGTTSGQDYNPTLNGTLFNVTTSGALTTLYAFPDIEPLGNSLVLGSDGSIYGDDSTGSLLEVTSSGTFSDLSGFTGRPDAVTQGSDGNFYAVSVGPGAGSVMKLVVSPSLPPPVVLSFSSSSAYLGSSVVLNWGVANAFSNTLKQCYASIQGNSVGGGSWNGLLNGVAAQSEYSGSVNVTPTLAGIYTYALTCGGVESGFASLTVNPADFSLSVNPASSSIAAGQSASFAISVIPLGAFTVPINFSCTSVPSGAACDFSPSTLTLGAASSSTTMTVTPPQPLSSSLAHLRPTSSLISPVVVLLITSFLTRTAAGKTRSGFIRLSFICAFFAIFLLLACGSDGTSGGGKNVPTTYNITVAGVSGTIQHDTNVSLTVQ